MTASSADAHPAAEDVARLAGDGPDPAADATEEVRAHVASCPSCGDLLDRIRSTRQLLAALPPVPIPAAVAERIDRSLAVERSGRPTPAVHRSGLSRLKPALAAAAVLAVLAGSAAALLHDTAGTSQKSATGSAAGSRAESAAPATAGDGPASIAARVRRLVAERGPNLPAPRSTASVPAAAPPPALSADTPLAAAGTDLSGCLAALHVPRSRLLVAAAGPFSGAPATIIVLRSQRAGRADVRVVAPSCGARGADLRYRADGLLLR